MDTYVIKDLDGLEQSASVLSNNGEYLADNAKSIEYLLKQINANWENAEGLDLTSINDGMNACYTQLVDTIIPLVREYAETLNELVVATREIQRREAATGGLQSTRVVQ